MTKHLAYQSAYTFAALGLWATACASSSADTANTGLIEGLAATPEFSSEVLEPTTQLVVLTDAGVVPAQCDVPMFPNRESCHAYADCLEKLPSVETTCRKYVAPNSPKNVWKDRWWDCYSVYSACINEERGEFDPSHAAECLARQQACEQKAIDRCIEITASDQFGDCIYGRLPGQLGPAAL